jgi:hypothetical protein
MWNERDVGCLREGGIDGGALTGFRWALGWMAAHADLSGRFERGFAARIVFEKTSADIPGLRRCGDSILGYFPAAPTGPATVRGGRRSPFGNGVPPRPNRENKNPATLHPTDENLPAGPPGTEVGAIRAFMCVSAQADRLWWWADYWAASTRASVRLLILAVRCSLSQLKGLPSMARLRVLKRTSEKSWR